MKKQGFTLIEMLIVISIVSILLIVFRNFFQSESSNIIEAQSCVNYLHNELRNFATIASLDKGIYQEGVKIFPSYYFIQMEINEGTIVFSYTTGDLNAQTGEYQRIVLEEYPQCIQKTGKISATGTDVILTMNAGEKRTIQQPSPFSLSDKAATHTTIIQLCTPDNTACKEIGKLIIDTRIQDIIKYTCNIFSGDNCQEWIQ